MIDQRVRSLAAVALLSLCAIGGSISALPAASADMTCRWGFGSVMFECSGDGCAPGMGFTPNGDFFAGCAAWDY
jgi:hypothetical protein